MSAEVTAAPNQPIVHAQRGGGSEAGMRMGEVLVFLCGSVCVSSFTNAPPFGYVDADGRVVPKRVTAVRLSRGSEHAQFSEIVRRTVTARISPHVRKNE